MIIPKVAERDVKTTKSLGPAYLLDCVSNEIQLRKKLSEAFGKDGDLILAVAMNRLLHQTSLKNLQHHLEDSFLPEIYSLKETFSSQWLSFLPPSEDGPKCFLFIGKGMKLRRCLMT
jgi:hypothetical protein